MPNRVPAEVFAPGELIRDELEARGWTQVDLAERLGVPEHAVNLIVAGRSRITPELAAALGKAFAVSADYFANLQKAYDRA